MTNRFNLRLTLLLSALLVAGIALSLRAATAAGRREVTLVARDMAYYLPGDPTPNPLLRLARGEQIHLTLINDDRGYQHDFVVPALGAATHVLDPDGSRHSIVVRAPDHPGRHEYACSLHAQMMKGPLEVF